MEAGSSGYGLNLVLADARVDAVTTNSKRMERDFCLTQITCAMSGQGADFDDGFSVIFGTEQYDWFADYVLATIIFGDGALTHRLPGEGTIIKKGDFIVVKARNVDSNDKRIALLFQGYHI